MSVQQKLGLQDEGLLVQQIRECWATWRTQLEPLAPVADFDELRGWLRGAEVEERDDLLHVLATQAAHDAGDDLIAAAALAWALLPGASSLAGRLSRLADGIDEHVATQLWIEVRCFPWRRRRRVAANILAATRTGVLLDLGHAGQLARIDRTWASARLVDMSETQWDCVGIAGLAGSRRRILDAITVGPEQPPTAAEEVQDVLDWGVDEGLISERDRLVLKVLVSEAADVPTRFTHTANAGLGSREATHRAAQRLGISAATVRRHLTRSLGAVSAAAPRYVA